MTKNHYNIIIGIIIKLLILRHKPLYLWTYSYTTHLFILAEFYFILLYLYTIIYFNVYLFLFEYNILYKTILREIVDYFF